jgi:SPP1 family predicted phage head-tail adaptor
MKLAKFTRIDIKEIKDKIINGRRCEKEETIFLTSYHAEILDLIGKEQYEAINLKLENTVIFKVRYCLPMEKLRDKKNFIVNWNGRKYKIYFVDFMAYKKKYIKIKCNEVL